MARYQRLLNVYIIAGLISKPLERGKNYSQTNFSKSAKIQSSVLPTTNIMPKTFLMNQ